MELFAGIKTVCGGFKGCGYDATSFEVADSPFENMLSGLGCAFAWALVARLYHTVARQNFAGASLCALQVKLSISRRVASCLLSRDWHGLRQYVHRGSG